MVRTAYLIGRAFLLMVADFDGLAIAQESDSRKLGFSTSEVIAPDITVSPDGDHDLPQQIGRGP